MFKHSCSFVLALSFLSGCATLGEEVDIVARATSSVRTCPKTEMHQIRLTTEVTAEWQEAITQAYSDWSAAMGNTYRYQVVVSDKPTDVKPACSTVWVKVLQIKEGAGYVAYAHDYTDENVVEVSKLASSFDFNRKRIVATHESGHLMGLKHPEEKDSDLMSTPSIMHASLEDSSEQITSYDREQICRVWDCKE